MKKTADRFERSQVATWETTKPWNASRKDLEYQMIPGVYLGQRRGSETASFDYDRITVTEDWLNMPEGTRRAVLYHEAGHGLESEVGYDGLASYFGVRNALDVLDLPGAKRLGYNVNEVVAEAYGVLWTEPEWFEGFEGGTAIRDIVVRMARDHGYPLPGNVSVKTASLPSGYVLHYTPGGNRGNHQVAVAFEGKVVGHLQWKGEREVWGGQRVPDDSEHGYRIEEVLIKRPPQIVDLKVAPEHRRKGLATAMYEEAKRREPSLVHDDIVLPDGQAWMKSLSVKAGARTAARTLSGGTIYRGLRANLPPDVDAKVRDLLAPETDEESYRKWGPYGGKKVQAGELIVRALEGSHWDSEMGLGRHWSERRDMAVAAAMQGGAGTWPILLTATYRPEDVDPDWDPDGPFMEAESEVRLRPGAQIEVTQVDLMATQGVFTSKGERVSYQPIRATAGKTAGLRFFPVDEKGESASGYTVISDGRALGQVYRYGTLWRAITLDGESVGEEFRTRQEAALALAGTAIASKTAARRKVAGGYLIDGWFVERAPGGQWNVYPESAYEPETGMADYTEVATEGLRSLAEAEAWIAAEGGHEAKKVAWQQSQSRDHATTMKMLDRVRDAAQLLSMDQATTLTRRILTDVRFPMGDQAEAVPHPSGLGRSSVAWDTGTQPPTPLVALAADMSDEFTTIHECAHIIRNGPSYAGVQSDSVIAHDDQWFTTFARLLSWYATNKCWRQFQFVFGTTPSVSTTAEKQSRVAPDGTTLAAPRRAGPSQAGPSLTLPRPVASSVGASEASWTPFQPPEHIQIMSDGDAVPGGWNGYFVAYDKATGRKMGYLDYQSHKEVEETEVGTTVTTRYVTIAMVEVEPEYRRQGVATVLLNALRHDFPDAVIDPGMTTPDGTAWWSKVGKTAAIEGLTYDSRYDEDFYNLVSDGPDQWRINQTWTRRGEVVPLAPDARLYTGQQALRGDIYPGPLEMPEDITDHPRLIRDGDRLVVVDGHHRLLRARRAGQTYPVLVATLEDFRETREAGLRGDLPDLRYEHLADHTLGDAGFEATDRGLDVLVAYDGTKPVGYISWMTNDDWRKGAVDALGVDDAYRRRGIATELLRRARQIEPEVNPANTPWFTDDGRAWWSRVGSAKVLPEVEFVHRKGAYVHSVTAYFDNDGVRDQAGIVEWGHNPGHERHGMVANIYVAPEYRRQGLATRLWEYAKGIEPALQHSPIQSPAGKEWAARVGRLRGRTAATHVRGFPVILTQAEADQFLDRLNAGDLRGAGRMLAQWVSEPRNSPSGWTNGGLGIWWSPANVRGQSEMFSGQGNLQLTRDGTYTGTTYRGLELGVLIEGNPDPDEVTTQAIRWNPGADVEVEAINVWVYDPPPQGRTVSHTGSFLRLPVGMTFKAQKTAGPANDYIPGHMRGPTRVAPTEMPMPRPVVIDRPAERDMETLNPSLRQKLVEVVRDIEDGYAPLEAKERDLAGVYTMRLSNAWRAAFYMGSEGFWHLMYVGPHDYTEVQNRWGRTSAREYVPTSTLPDDEYLNGNNVSRLRRLLESGQAWVDKKACPKCGQEATHDNMVLFDGAVFSTCNRCGEGRISEPGRFGAKAAVVPSERTTFAKA